MTTEDELNAPILVQRYSTWLQGKTGKNAHDMRDVDGSQAAPEPKATTSTTFSRRKPSKNLKLGSSLQETEATLKAREVERLLLRSEIVKQFQCAIPLRPTNDPVTGEEAAKFRQGVRREYATKYLENIGVTPTPKNIHRLLQAIPIKDAHMTEYYVSRGWMQDYVMVDPGPVWNGQDPILNPTKLHTYGRGAKVERAMREAALNRLLFREGMTTDSGISHPPATLHPAPPSEARRAAQQPAPVVGEQHAVKQSSAFQTNIRKVADAEMSTPFHVSSDDAFQTQSVFVDLFPFHLYEHVIEPDTKRLVEQTIRSSLICQLIILASNLCYLMHVAKHAPGYTASQDDAIAERARRLFVQCEEAFSEVDIDIRHRPDYVSFHVPVVLLSLQVGVESVFKNRFPRFLSFHPEIPQAIQQTISGLFDPAAYRSRVGFFDPREGGDMVAHQTNKLYGRKANFYTTSPTIQALYSGSAHPRVRHFFAQGKPPPRQQRKLKGSVEPLQKEMGPHETARLHRVATGRLEAHHRMRVSTRAAAEARNALMNEPAAPVPLSPRRRKPAPAADLLANIHEFVEKVLAQLSVIQGARSAEGAAVDAMTEDVEVLEEKAMRELREDEIEEADAMEPPKRPYKYILSRTAHEARRLSTDSLMSKALLAETGGSGSRLSRPSSRGLSRPPSAGLRVTLTPPVPGMPPMLGMPPTLEIPIEHERERNPLNRAPKFATTNTLLTPRPPSAPKNPPQRRHSPQAAKLLELQARFLNGDDPLTLHAAAHDAQPTPSPEPGSDRSVG